MDYASNPFGKIQVRICMPGQEIPIQILKRKDKQKECRLLWLVEVVEMNLNPLFHDRLIFNEYISNTSILSWSFKPFKSSAEEFEPK